MGDADDAPAVVVPTRVGVNRSVTSLRWRRWRCPHARGGKILANTYEPYGILYAMQCGAPMIPRCRNLRTLPPCQFQKPQEHRFQKPQNRNSKSRTDALLDAAGMGHKYDEYAYDEKD